MTLDDLPALNASLNGLATVFLVAGYLFIRSDRKPQHIACMVGALVASAVFLTSYLIYHFSKGEPTRFPVEYGAVRYVYYAILASHVLLAIVNLPMIIMTVVPALRRRFDRHRKIARWTWPVWMYVSVTGVIVYLMLYRWFPPTGGAAG